jgi:LacI family transcriptional regulator
MRSARPALLDGTLTFVISHPLAGMVRAVSTPSEGGNFTTILPFEIYTRENI